MAAIRNLLILTMLLIVCVSWNADAAPGAAPSIALDKRANENFSLREQEQPICEHCWKQPPPRRCPKFCLE
uniref:U-scoloptoxin(04)-Er3a n=1 Tax=Ethmostigmus rubripes TaxID=62613 RepID=TX43A_ETHRU|nr:RecName: Full=U-scoloptoxin(04)-Er3a; Short=U-SLPTX(04)-Er3a; Flags: Precursor [Ethmostigmus rubripes]